MYCIILHSAFSQRLPLCLTWAFSDGSACKESTCNTGDAGDMGSIPGRGRSPGGGHDNPHQYSCLENPTDRVVWWAMVCGVIKSLTRLTTSQHTASLICFDCQNIFYLCVAYP